MADLKLKISKTRLTNLCRKQLPLKDIAKKLGCSIATVEFRIHLWDIPYVRPFRGGRAQYKELYDRYFSGTPVAQLADELGISADTVYSRLRRYKDLLAELRAIEARKKRSKET